MGVGLDGPAVDCEVDSLASCPLVPFAWVSTGSEGMAHLGSRQKGAVGLLLILLWAKEPALRVPDECRMKEEYRSNGSCAESRTAAKGPIARLILIIHYTLLLTLSQITSAQMMR